MAASRREGYSQGQGCPLQGGPLSPLLSNIVVLNELDKELERCGLLTFLPDRYVYIWILMSIPFYVYLFLYYLNYMLFYEQVENAIYGVSFRDWITGLRVFKENAGCTPTRWRKSS